MIWVNSIKNSLFTTLSSDSTLVSSGFVVTMDGEINEDYNVNRWLGVYLTDIQAAGARMNQTNPWLAEINLQILLQTYNQQDFQLAGQLLDASLALVLTSVNSNRTLDNTVNMIKEWKIVPFHLQGEGRTSDIFPWFNMYQIGITAEVFA